MQTYRVGKILVGAGISAFYSEPSEKTPSEAYVITGFRWRDQIAGIVIDCGKEDGDDIFITGHLPTALTIDKTEGEIVADANRKNSNNANVQIFITEEGKVNVRRRLEAANGIDSAILINALYDVMDVLFEYRSDARRRGIFPCDPHPTEDKEE